MFPKFRFRNAIPAVIYGVATALEFWHIMKYYAAQFPEIAPDAALAAFSAFLINACVAAIFCNLLDFHGVGVFHAFESRLYGAKRGIGIAFFAMSSGLVVGWLTSVGCSYLQMTGIETFFEMTVAELIAFWSISMVLHAVSESNVKTG